jgi:diguanylate cyclase (GGDEF)-like protein
MAKDESKFWADNSYVIKDSLFHRRVSDIQHRTAWNINEREAIELLKDPEIRASMFNPMGPVRELSDDEVDMRAFYDSQTPTYNFRYLVRNFRREMARSIRYKRFVSVLVVSTEQLVKISAESGVEAVNLSLEKVASILVNSCRADIDMVARYTEDRFILLCPETTGRGAKQLAARLSATFAETEIKYKWHTFSVVASIGIAYFPGHGNDIETLIAQAEMAAEMVSLRGGQGVLFAPELIATDESSTN